MLWKRCIDILCLHWRAHYTNSTHWFASNLYYDWRLIFIVNSSLVTRFPVFLEVLFCYNCDSIFRFISPITYIYRRFQIYSLFGSQNWLYLVCLFGFPRLLVTLWWLMAWFSNYYNFYTFYKTFFDIVNLYFGIFE